MRGLVVTILIAFAWQIRAQVPVQVTTGKGTLVGYHVDLGNDPTSFYTGSADVFLGIPFAHPPVGPLRFKKPVSVSSYVATPLNVTTNKPACLQPTEDLNMSEDCLYLNVYTPSISSTKKLPVMVYIHGGSFLDGFADYSPQAAIRFYTSKKVVFVAIQYRLAMLGFFTTHSEEFPANLGMLDQVEALKWIKSEISHFGGDPNRVTLIGQSAGAAAASAHSYSPLSKNLFHSVILHSGACGTCFDGARGFFGNSELRALQLCNFTRTEWESRDYSRLHSCLMSKHWYEFIALDVGNMEGWLMSQDNYFMPDVPRNLASQRKKIPVLIGSVIDEYAAWLLLLSKEGLQPLKTVNRTTFDKNFAFFLGYLPPLQREIVKNVIEGAYKVNEAVIYSDWVKKISDVFTASLFVTPMQTDIRDHLANGNRRVFVYELSHQSPFHGLLKYGDWKPVIHSSDIPYFNPFPEVWLPALDNGLVTSRDLEILEWMSDSWTTFAKTGYPTPDWHPAHSHRLPVPYLEISTTGNVMRPSYRLRDEAVWNGIIPQIVGIEPPVRPDYNNGSIYQPYWQPSLI